MLEADPVIEVIGTARDGIEGFSMAAELKPDVITLDVKMPALDGLATLEKILAFRPVPVLMLSSFTGEGAEVTLKALELGAMDFLDKSSVKSSMDIAAIGPVLIQKIRTLAGIADHKIKQASLELPAPPSEPLPPEQVGFIGGAYDMLAIGCSTGGPSVLQSILVSLPADYPLPVVVVQHMPPGFTRPLAERLNSIASVQVVEGAHGELLTPGKVVIAPAGQHLLVRRREGRLVAMLSSHPENALHRPSIDELMSSVSKSVGARAVGVLLTGMGKDGARGLLAMRRAGAMTVAQDEASSVVWGMPRAALDLGAVQLVLSATSIRDRLLDLAFRDEPAS